MKKIFTLAALFVAAIGANAQEKWSVANEDGTLKAEYVANADASQASVVTFKTENVEGTHVSGPIAGYEDGTNEAHELTPKVDNSWGNLSTKKLSADGSVAPFFYVQGKGNPVNLEKVFMEEIIDSETGEGTGKWRANWNDSYYKPDGTAGIPSNGTYVTLKAAVNGTMKVGAWINKGNREIFVVKASDAKALAFGTDIKLSGYINGKNNDVAEEDTENPLKGYNKFFEELQTKAQLYQAFNDTCTDKNDIKTIGELDAYIVGEGNQAAWVYLTWEAVAGETYYVFNKSTQIGFSGFEFTAGGGDTPGEGGMNWDFTKWSANDLANLKAEAAQYPIDKLIDPTLWRSYEKADGSTEDKGGACYWYGTAVAEGELVEMTANGVALEGLKGLKFGPLSGGSLAIAVNYPETSLGTYAGGSYLWMGGKNNSFTIPGVKKGDVITMDVESHKPSDARGVAMTMAGAAVAPTSGSETPTVKETVVWTVPADGDATFTNNNGCHIYYIKIASATGIDNAIVDNAQKTVVGYYTINGVQNNGLVKGLNIVKFSDGSSVKVIK